MSSETTTAAGTATRTTALKGGVLAGLLGGVAMGVMLTTQMNPVISKAIPAMYGLSGIAAGWVVHLFHALVLGVVFAAIASSLNIDSTAKSVGLGVGFGLLTWAVLAVLVMPIWLGAVGFPNAPDVPNVSSKSFVGHVVYGLVLGVVFPYVETL
ncbi:DUF6789 family protein [Halorussus halophilus]|uniref:DUF6789 family protein n=1 Tax=Halorussus halophilus TaxID=2650975 RepID=UPI0013018609|nr:DUF6789 family protein [Halorussus halophilus]